MNLPVQTHESNQRHHSVRLEEGLLHRILAKVIADQIGVDLNASNVRFKVSIDAPYANSISPDFSRKSATVTITEDFGPAGA